MSSFHLDLTLSEFEQQTLSRYDLPNLLLGVVAVDLGSAHPFGRSDPFDLDSVRPDFAADFGFDLVAPLYPAVLADLDSVLDLVVVAVVLAATFEQGLSCSASHHQLGCGVKILYTMQLLLHNLEQA